MPLDGFVKDGVTSTNSPIPLNGHVDRGAPAIPLRGRFNELFGHPPGTGREQPGPRFNELFGHSRWVPRCQSPRSSGGTCFNELFDLSMGTCSVPWYTADRTAWLQRTLRSLSMGTLDLPSTPPSSVSRSSKALTLATVIFLEPQLQRTLRPLSTDTLCVRVPCSRRCFNELSDPSRWTHPFAGSGTTLTVALQRTLRSLSTDTPRVTGRAPGCSPSFNEVLDPSRRTHRCSPDMGMVFRCSLQRSP